ncbi:MAG: transposase [Myxococcota bacterium]
MEVYVGVDWAARECVCAVTDGSHEPRPLFDRLHPSVDAARRMLEQARAAVGAAQTDTVRVVIEAGAPGWVHILHTACAVVHVVDAKQARRFAESRSSSGAKDDRRDAVSLANMCRSEQHRPPPFKPDSAEIQQLVTLAAAHESHTKDFGRTRQRIREQLRQTMPLVDQALPTDLETKWAVRLLRVAPTPWHAKQLTREAFDDIARRASKSFRDRMWDALQKCDAPWIDEGIATSLATVLRHHLDQLELLQRQLGRDRPPRRPGDPFDDRAERRLLDGGDPPVDVCGADRVRVP